ncbi:hypothetical protein EUTSA_v10017575mg [Eutrema salsugineum]|uniref:F-box domain-containing protein n=1 Tax=Eutrema salsugineum TaxID=72664 RepID=V4LLH2_EUTSA|nr:hypothetical protein EUTSA_v10017575mg [Eutrema salsugineum]
MVSEEVEPTQKKIPQSSSSFSLLPDEITENILARVSRWNYPSLSLVSKKFCSLLSSMEIYKTRSEIGADETCFYVCLQLHNQPYPRWFSLWAKPNQTPTKQSGEIRFKQDPSGNSVVPTFFAYSDSPHIRNNSTIRVGSEIYIIGGVCMEPSSAVRILDCRSHTWRDAPNMTVAREDACAVVIDEKIYVTGGCKIDDWFEVFDVKTQSWTVLPGPRGELRNIFSHNSRSGRPKGVYSRAERWYMEVREKSSITLHSIAIWLKIDTVIYGCTFHGKLMWLASKTQGEEWREIKGLGKLLEHKSGRVFEMADYDGKLLFMWDVCDDKRKNKIRYAKISLESRCNGCEVWGKVDCVDAFTFPVEAYKSFCCLAVPI